MCSFLAMRALQGHGLPLDEAGHVEINEVAIGLGLQELAEHDRRSKVAPVAPPIPCHDARQGANEREERSGAYPASR